MDNGRFPNKASTFTVPIIAFGSQIFFFPPICEWGHHRDTDELLLVNQMLRLT